MYLLNKDQHTVGQETASTRPNICLSSPDILPLHCRIRRRRSSPSSSSSSASSSSSDHRLSLEPVGHGAVLINFTRIERPTPLRHGDLLSFGAHYIFLYRDPLSAKPLPGHTLSRLRALGAKNEEACPTCGAAPREQAGFRQSSKGAKGPKKRKLVLEFERAQEDALVNRVLTLIEPSGDDHKLTPAYLLCLCVQHSALTFPPGSFGKLLLKIAKKIQSIVWVRPLFC